MAEARAEGLTLSFDVNYRSRLWAPDLACETLLPLIADLDLLICTSSDAEQVFGLTGSARDVLEGLGGLTGAGLIALTRGGEGATLWDRRDFYHADPFAVQAIDRVGAGDAFDAGLVWGFLNGDPERGLRHGMAMAALKHTLPGDEFISSAAEIETLLQIGHQDIRR